MPVSVADQTKPTFPPINAERDATLLNLCDHFSVLEQAIRLLWRHDDEDLWMCIERKQKKIVDKIQVFPPTTLTGFQAIARAMMGWTKTMREEDIDDLTGVDADLLIFFLRSLVQMEETADNIAGSVTRNTMWKIDDLEPTGADDLKLRASSTRYAMRIDFGQDGQCDFPSAAAACRFFKLRRGELARMRSKTGESWESLIRAELIKFHLRDDAEAQELVVKYPRSKTH